MLIDLLLLISYNFKINLHIQKWKIFIWKFLSHITEEFLLQLVVLKMRGKIIELINITYQLHFIPQYIWPVTSRIHIMKLYKKKEPLTKNKEELSSEGNTNQNWWWEGPISRTKRTDKEKKFKRNPEGVKLRLELGVIT